MAATCGVVEYGDMTYRELFVRWQVALKTRFENLAHLLCTIDNVGVSIIKAIPLVKCRASLRKLEDYLPWGEIERGEETIRLEKDDFHFLKPLVIPQ